MFKQSPTVGTKINLPNHLLYRDLDSIKLRLKQTFLRIKGPFNQQLAVPHTHQKLINKVPSTVLFVI